MTRTIVRLLCASAVSMLAIGSASAQTASSPRMTGEMETVPAATAPAAGGMDGVTNGAGGFDFYQQ